jgi:EAL domain-containing protein (putative c-di-GMP-specific phosphodiesterase class I)
LVVLEESCSTIGQLNEENRSRELFVSVNLSGKHFDHPDLVDHISDTLRRTGLDPRCLKLEITETAIMANADVSVDMLRSIQDLGVQISIDDFGTGYSSLNYLHKFPLDTLKIDRSFVNSIERGSENAEIVRTVVYLAKALGLDVVAEGIESIHQLSQLQQLGCEYGQGYLFSRPVPKDAIAAFLTDDLGWQSLTRTTPYHLDHTVHDVRLVG